MFLIFPKRRFPNHSTSCLHWRSYRIHSNSWREKRLNDPNLCLHPSNEKNTCSIQLASSGLMNTKILLYMSTKSKLVHYAKWRLYCDMYLLEKKHATSFACSVGKNKNKFESINSPPFAIGNRPNSLSAGFPFRLNGTRDINHHLCCVDMATYSTDTHNNHAMSRGKIHVC